MVQQHIMQNQRPTKSLPCNKQVPNKLAAQRSRIYQVPPSYGGGSVGKPNSMVQQQMGGRPMVQQHMMQNQRPTKSLPCNKHVSNKLSAQRSRIRYPSASQAAPAQKRLHMAGAQPGG